VTEVGAERVRDAELRLDDARDVRRSVADLVDRVGDPQDALDRLGVLRAAGGQDGERPEPPEVPAHALLELLDLAREVLLVEEDRGVGQVDQQLGGVLGLDEEFLDVPGLLIHG
jgi:hypothetical protein